MSIDYTLPLALSITTAVAAAAFLLALALARVTFRVLRRPWSRRRRLSRTALAIFVAGCLSTWATARIKGATMEQAAVDLAMTEAPRPPRDWRSSIVPPAPYMILAGDLHCHINPPDWSDHVARKLPETIQIAREEQIDFISLVPHVFSDFPEIDGKWARVAELVKDLQARVDARPADGLILDVGVEYIDPSGHFNMLFGDVPKALAAAEARPRASSTGPRPGYRPPEHRAEDFVAAFVDQGGILVVNHPLLTPIRSWVPLARLDISWQPFTGRPPFRPEIAAADARASAFEAANLFVSDVRDRFLKGDREESMRNVLALLDQQILARRRRMTPVGGTDSHSFHLRPMTFVLAEQRSREAIRDAIRAGRTCVAQPAACTFEARAEGAAAFLPVGSSIMGASRVEVRAGGRAVVIHRNGERVAAPTGGQVASIDVARDACSVLRATVDGGYSAPIYVNCPFASEVR
ncbi:MAG: hypothetical protein QM820_56440 [Minicystis sp.]